VPEPVLSSSDAELRQHVQRTLSANYEVDREIGRGGMGIVYLARDTRLKRPVAVKLLPPELAFRPEIRTRFLREAETAAQLSHPNIVPIYSVDERDGLVYFVMGYVDGGNLAARLSETGAMPADRVRQVLCEVADALAYAHDRGVVHRDIKPDNILLSLDDERAVVTDFGIARAISEGADSRLTATGIAIGTPTYMSPEQAAGEREIDGRSDLYSLGIVGYQMLAGEPPFSANSTPALLVKHLSEQPRPIGERRPDVPPELARAVMLLLEKDPANRFPSAESLGTALETRTIPEGMGAIAPAPAGGGAARNAPAPLAAMGSSLATPEPDAPTLEEIRRWEAPNVREFRRKLAPFLFVNAVIIIFAIFGGADFLFVTAIWSIMMAFQYAKLWADGYDWRDVFKQPHDRMMFDVAAETIDDARALFDAGKREELRERNRTRAARLTAANVARVAGGDPASGSGGGAAAATGGVEGSMSELASEEQVTLRRAQADHDEIQRIVGALSRSDRRQLPDVADTARQLLGTVRSLALSVSELRRSATPGAGEVVEREIQQLEAQANPLDRTASNERVHRLAYLKRQRRALMDAERRMERDTVRLESCMLALQNMRLDLGRLKAGNQTPGQVTLLAERALSLAQDVDGIVMAEDEVRGAGSATSSGSVR